MSKEESGNQFSRRDFLKNAALVGAGMSVIGTLAACSPQGKQDSKQSTGGANTADVSWAKETDVVVVGFGGAGSAAAIEAKKAGAEVTILETTTEGGGSTVANGGFIMMGGTKLQKGFGLEDSVDNFYAYLSAAAGENANKEAIRLICDKSPELYDWCVECGMDFASGTCDTVHHMGGDKAGISLGYSGNELARDFAAVAPSVPRGHMPQPSSSGKDIFGPLKQTAEEAGVEVLYKTSGTKLIADETGRIVGVIAKGPDGEMSIKARKGVILTCGGFIDNKGMLEAYYPFVNKRGPAVVSMGTEDGSGITMGEAVGAATFGMGCFQIGKPMITTSEPLAKAVLINEKGHRIVAEDESSTFIGKAIIQAPTSACYVILSDAAKQEADLAHFGEPILTVSTLDEIPAQIGVNADALKATFAFYNESAALGEDREFGKDAKFLIPLEAGPFHIFDSGSETCHTASCGGLKIDIGAHVLDLEDRAIPNLYSAGRNAGTIYGWYMGSGSSMADVLTYGRIAGRNAAAEQSL